MTKQTNPNIEDKRIVEVWDWHDGYSNSRPTKKLFMKIRRKRQKVYLDKLMENEEFKKKFDKEYEKLCTHD